MDAISAVLAAFVAYIGISFVREDNDYGGLLLCSPLVFFIGKILMTLYCVVSDVKKSIHGLMIVRNTF